MPLISVIIPTYNRLPFLLQALEALGRQSLPGDRFEVVVVDDGSTDDTGCVAERSFPFGFRYIRQVNGGDAAARNAGIEHSEANLLVFLDDDVLVTPRYLEHLLAAHEAGGRRIVVGTERLWLADELPPNAAAAPKENDRLHPLPFAEMCSNNMSITREGYLELGMMQGLSFPGSSMWCDTDFAYRAFQAGYEFWRSELAIAWHRDYTMRSLASQLRRAEESSFRAVALFHRHPALLAYLPMFEDKSPISWREDRPSLIIRKLARPLTSSRALLSGLEWVARRMPEGDQSPLVVALSRWIIGGYVYRGYRRGLRKFGRPPAAQVDLYGSGTDAE